MRLVYLDEAGLSNPKQEPYVVVAGVIIDADRQLAAIEAKLDELVDRYIPEEHRADFVFHATELFNGGGKVFVRDPPDYATAKWPLSKRVEIAESILQMIVDFNLPIAVGYVNRSEIFRDFEFPREMTPHERVVGAHVVAFTVCSMAVDGWMKMWAEKEICLLIVEDNPNARQLIRGSQRHYKRRDFDFEGAATHFPLTKIKEDPLFQEKRKSSPLQLADMCAYTIKRFVMNPYDPLYAPLFDRLRPVLVDASKLPAGAPA